MTVSRLGIAGAGTMGAGIAQLGVLGGLQATLYDPDPEALERGAGRLREALAKGVAKGRWGQEAADAAAGRLSAVSELIGLGDCELVVEAAPEDLGLKRGLLISLAGACGDDAVLATNTSSLPVGAIAEPVPRPARVCGLHFFNPPALMRLVEVVAAEQTDPATVETAESVVRAMGRDAVRCTDSPGFIVNRCNRPFTLESLQIVGEGLATHSQLDLVIREDGGYRMGPFELMDLIGIDVNLEIARSFYAQRAEPRWEPHPIQERMVAEGRLGRKTGHGYYDYAEGGDGARPDVDAPDPALRQELLERVVCQLVNEASYAAGEGVASPDDIDSAMRLGLNQPRGPFEWLSELGPAQVVRTLDSLRDRLGPRYEAAPLLRERAGRPGPAGG